MKKNETRARPVSSKGEESRRIITPAEERHTRSAAPIRHYEFEKKKFLAEKNSDFKQITKLLARAVPFNNYLLSQEQDLTVLTANTTENDRLHKFLTDSTGPSRRSSKDIKKSTKKASAQLLYEKNFNNSGSQYVQPYSKKENDGRYLRSDYISNVQNQKHSEAKLVQTVENFEFPYSVRDSKLKMLRGKLKVGKQQLEKNITLDEPKMMKSADDAQKTQGDKLNEIKAVKQIYKKSRYEEFDPHEKKNIPSIAHHLKRMNRSYF